MEVFALSDACIIGSKAEGFGIPNIEAQLLGCPVVGNAFGATGDYNYYGIPVKPK